MRKIHLLLFLLGGCVSGSPSISLEDTARKIHSRNSEIEYGLYFRDIEDGETLEISAETSFTDARGRHLSILGRVLEGVNSGRIDWRTVRIDLEKMLRNGDADAAVNLITRFGRDAETSLSPRACSRLVEGFFSEEYVPGIPAFLEANATRLGRFQSPSGRLYVVFSLSNGGEISAGEEAIHAYMASKP